MTVYHVTRAAGLAVLLGLLAGLTVSSKLEPGETPAVLMPASGAAAPRAGCFLGDGTRIVLKPENAPSSVSVHLPNRRVLEEALALSPGIPLLIVRQVCGQEYRFETIADLPRETLSCRCGLPQCIVVLYTRDAT